MIAKPKPTKADRTRKPKKSKPRRQVLESQLEAICKQIVFWRDGCQCVESDIDGARCGNGIQWGHFIPRKQSNWLKYDLGNTFCQCGSHNYLHDKGAVTMSAWFAEMFGPRAIKVIDATARAHSGGKKRTTQELEEMLVKYQALYDNRFTSSSYWDFIRNGYYGEILKENV